MKTLKYILTFFACVGLFYMVGIFLFLFASWAVRYPWQNWAVIFIVIGVVVGIPFTYLYHENDPKI